MFTFLVELGFEMEPWAVFTDVKKKDKMHAHICGGGRVSDGVVSPFAQKKNGKVHVHIFGGIRVRDGAMSL